MEHYYIIEMAAESGEGYSSIPDLPRTVDLEAGIKKLREVQATTDRICRLIDVLAYGPMEL